MPNALICPAHGLLGTIGWLTTYRERSHSDAFHSTTPVTSYSAQGRPGNQSASSTAPAEHLSSIWSIRFFSMMCAVEIGFFESRQPAGCSGTPSHQRLHAK